MYQKSNGMLFKTFNDFAHGTRFFLSLFFVDEPLINPSRQRQQL